MIMNRYFDEKQNDFEKMLHFLQADNQDKKEDFTWQVCRLGDWKFGLWNEKKLIPSFFRKNAQLWFDENKKLIGFVLSENGDNIIFIFTIKKYEFLYSEILNWTIKNWGLIFSSLLIELRESQKDEITILEQKGFQSKGIIATTRSYELSSKASETINLPAGFRIVNMLENKDYHSKGILAINAFENQNQISDFDLMKFEYSRENPAYDPTFDFSVITQDGVHVASCVGLLDKINKISEIEKVCTHQNYRRLGLSESVIKHCFQKLYSAGFNRAFLTAYGKGADQLYEKLGPSNRQHWLHYELKFINS
ncbi:MAG: GNAT family N-acetyltransferase [Anaerolineaceae bacterium]|nr:GNAT family N-acetyltransferase [Anaerolineaceae bacterium]